MTAGSTGRAIGPPVTFLHDGEWAQIGGLMVYPREDGTYSIGTPESVGGTEAPCWRDVDGETGFAAMDEAIERALRIAGGTATR